MTLEGQAERRARTRIHYGYVVAVLGMLALVGAQGLGRFGYPLILPGMKEGLHLTYAQTGLLAGVNSGGYLLSSVWAGAFGARHGPRRVISIALAGIGAAMLVQAFAPTFTVSLAMQFLIGTGMAFVSVPAMAMCSAWFAPSRRGLAAGLVSAGSGLGLVAAGAVVPLIYHTYGEAWWRWAWGYFGLAVLVLSALAAVLLRDRPAPGEPRVGETVAAPAPAAAAKPSLWTPEVWRMSLVWYLALLSGINTFAYVGFTTFFAAYLINERGVEPSVAGALWGLAGAIALVSGMLWGTLSDRAGRQTALLLIFVVQIACFLLFALSSVLLGYLVAAVLYGLIARANFAVSAAASGDIAGPALAPAAFGINALGAGLGLTIGPIVGGPLIDMTGSFQAVFLMSAGAAALGLVASLRLRMPQTSL
jgi:MFS family permease